MNPEQWSQLKALFNAALDLPDGERATFVARASREHPDLAARLRAMVASHAAAAAEDFLAQPAVAALDPGAEYLEGSDLDPGPLNAGDVLDQTYDVEGRLGHGGMGVVYRVRHRALGRSFAAKLVHAGIAADAKFVERFSREAEALGRLKHPHIVDVTDFGVDREGGSRPYLVMELLEGPTLHERLASGPMSPHQALPIFEALADAIDHAHAQGVLHLDLKPGNVVLVPGRDGADTPKILDFGLAQFHTAGSDRAETERPSQLIGTPAYMAPELFDGQPTTRAADLYAFGIVMYETLTGRPPFQGSVAEIRQQQRAGVATRTDISGAALHPEVTSALREAFALDPGRRPRSARAAVERVRLAAVIASQAAWKKREVPRRLALAMAIGLVALSLFPVLRASSLIDGLEATTVDARYGLARLATAASPHPAIVLLVLDEASLDADTTPVTERADQFGVDLQRIFDAGARAVAIDFQPPEPWSHSVPFSQLVLRHADRLTLAASSPTEGAVLGGSAIAGVITVALGPERARALFGFIDLDEDEDGVNRRSRLTFPAVEGTPVPSFAGRAAATWRAGPPPREFESGQRFWVDHTVEAREFELVSWKDLGSRLAGQPQLFRDKLILVGASYLNSGDDARIPGGRVPGVFVHALTVSTILNGFPVRAMPAVGSMLVVALMCVMVAASVLLGRNTVRLTLTVAGIAATYTGVVFGTFMYSKLLLALVTPMLLAGAGGVVASVLRRRLPPFPRGEPGVEGLSR